LTTLEGGPEDVKGDFDCSGNQLISLLGCPAFIMGDFSCAGNQLTLLNGEILSDTATIIASCPEIV